VAAAVRGEQDAGSGAPWGVERAGLAGLGEVAVRVEGDLADRDPPSLGKLGWSAPADLRALQRGGDHVAAPSDRKSGELDGHRLVAPLLGPFGVLGALLLRGAGLDLRGVVGGGLLASASASAAA
jgi:hypothetical protein